MGIFREVFGAGKSEIWQQLAREIGAEYVSADFWKGEKVQARYKSWTITLDTQTTNVTSTVPITLTRMRAPFVNKDGFRFEVYRRTFFSGISKLLGAQDIATGFPEIDDAFIIKSNSETKIKELFANEKFRSLLLSQPDVSFLVKDDEGWFGEDFPEGVDELYFQVSGVLKDLERLKTLYELFSETLNQLCLIGSAYESDPQLTL